MRNLITGLTVIVVLSAALWLYMSSENKPEKPRQLTIGVALPLSGDGAAFGEKAQKGITIALNQINDKNLSIVYADTHDFSSQGAVTAVQKLTSMDKVDVIIGPLGPEPTLATADITRQAGVVHMAYSLCSPDYAEYKNLFCIYPSIKEQLAQLPHFLKQQNIATIAIVTEQSAYGIESKAALTEHEQNNSYSILFQEEVALDTTDFKTIAAKIINQQPDAVFVAMADVAKDFLFIKQITELGFTGERIAYVDTDPSYLEQFGEVLEGVYVPGALGSNYNNTYTNDFVSTYDEDPDLYSAIAYDVTKYVYGAWTKNKKQFDGLGNSLTEYVYEDPAIPDYNLQNDRTVSFPTEIWVVENGAYQQYTQ